MESTFAPPPSTDCPPGPDTLTAESAPAPATSAVALIAPALLERITIGPVAPWVIERTPNIQERKDSGANPIFLLDWQHHAGGHESYKRIVARLDTTSAVHEASQWRLDFDPATQSLTIHALTVRRGDRSVDNAKPERLRVLQREEGLEDLVLHGRLTVVVLLEDVRAGDVLDVSFTVHTESRIFPHHFFELITIPPRTLRDFHLRVRFPKALPLQWKSNDPQLTPTVREDADETEWSWQVSNVSGGEPEPNVPGWYFVDRWIQVTDFPSWAEVAAGLLAAWPEDLQNPEVLRLVESISSEAAVPVLRAERALTFLQDEIRNLNVDTGLGDQIPASPGIVLKRGFGDCLDKTLAAAHLLRLLGISARPVLVNTLRRQAIRGYLPMPVFNHAILEYEIDGRRRWVDVTVPLQGGSALSRPIAPFQAGLPLGPGVEDLEAIDRDESSDRTELQETFLLDSSGRASSVRVQVTATGREAEKWRRSLAHEGVEAFARQRELHYQQLYTGALRVGKLEWQDNRESNELVLAEVFDLRDILFDTPDSNGLFFRFQAHAIQAVLGFYESGRRRHPWELRFPCRVRHIIEVESSELPQNLGRTAQVDGNAFRFSCHSQQRPGFTSITFLLQMLADHVRPQEFEAHKAKVREVWPLTIIMGKLPPGSVVPWKKRSGDNLLPRTNLRAPQPPLTRPNVPAPSPSHADATPAPGSPGEVAPPLPSKATRENSNVTPRPIRSSRPEESPNARERSAINRPNPSPIAPGPATPWKSSRRSRSQRRQRHQRQRLTMWVVASIGAAFLAAMILLLLHGM